MDDIWLSGGGGRAVNFQQFKTRFFFQTKRKHLFFVTIKVSLHLLLGPFTHVLLQLHQVSIHLTSMCFTVLI